MKKRMRNIGYVILLCLVLAGCGGKGADTVSETPTEQENIAESKEKPDKSEEGKEDKKEDTAVIPEFQESEGVEEKVVYEGNDLVITFTGMDYTISAVEFNFLIENNGADELSIITGSLRYSCNSINGYMVEGHMNSSVEGGKKANEKIRVDKDTLEILGISKIVSANFGFYISDGNNNRLHTGEWELKFDGADEYDYEADSYKDLVKSGAIEKITEAKILYYNDEIEYDIDGISIASEAFIQNKDGEKVLIVEVQNKTDNIVNVAVSDIKYNGLLVEDSIWTSEIIAPGCRRLVGLSTDRIFSAADRQAIGMDTIGEIAYTFAVSDVGSRDYINDKEVTVIMDPADSLYQAEGETVYDDGKIKMISLGIIDCPEEFMNYVTWMFIIENQSDYTIHAQTKMDTLSFNGFMIDSVIIHDSVGVDKGERALIMAEVNFVEEDEAKKAAEISEAEVQFQIKDMNYNIIAQPKIIVSFP